MILDGSLSGMPSKKNKSHQRSCFLFIFNYHYDSHRENKDKDMMNERQDLVMEKCVVFRCD